MRLASAVIALLACSASLACAASAPSTGPPRAIIDPVHAAPLPGLQAEALVVWDTLGVPHIQASSRLDLYRALGYVTARDRLWQIDWMRRSARGTAASLLGNSVLRQDGAARILGIAAWADSAAARLDPSAFPTRALDAFAAGVNAYIDAARELPREYRAIGKKPQRWRPSDTIALILGQGLSLDFETDEVDNLRWRDAWGARRAGAFMQYDPLVRYTTVEGEVRRGGGAHAAASTQDARHASNAWTVSGALSASGKPLLANDPHLELEHPSVWYLVHLAVPDTLNAAGVMVPGVPVIISGRNTHAAWGITALGADVVDYTTELLSPDGRSFRDGDVWHPLRRTSLGLRYALGPLKLSVPYAREETPRGPILLKDGNGRRGFAVRWAPLTLRTVDLGAVGLESSRSVDDVRAHVRHISTPALNVVMADDAGHIAYQAVGAIPHRVGALPTYPRPGWLHDDPWRGMIPADSLPHALDPARGFLVSANNEPSRRGPRIGAYASSEYRAARIHSLLAQAGSALTLDDMARIQLDVRVPEAGAFLDSMCAIVERTPGVTADEARSLDALRAWDRTASLTSTEAAVFRAWLAETRRACEMTRSHGLFAHMLRDAQAGEWWDDPDTRERETAGVVLSRSLRSARGRLADSLGADPSAWTWGRAHAARLRHPVHRFTGPIVSAPGDQNTVNHGASALPRTTAYTHGVSVRLLADLGESGVMRVSMPSTNRGDADPATVRRAMEKWSRGEYDTLRLAVPTGAARQEALSLFPR